MSAAENEARADRALKQYDAARRTLIEAAAEAPRLVAERVTDDGEEFDALRCPRCGELVEHDALVAVDTVDRWSYAEEVTDEDFDRNRITFNGSAGDENIHYEVTTYLTHGDPGLPGSHIVALPEGWTEDWS